MNVYRTIAVVLLPALFTACADGITTSSRASSAGPRHDTGYFGNGYRGTSRPATTDSTADTTGMTGRSAPVFGGAEAVVNTDDGSTAEGSRAGGGYLGNGG